MKMLVVEKGGYYFTPETQEEFNDSILIEFTDEHAEALECGFGVQVNETTI